MAVQFSLEYSTDPNDHKFGEDVIASAVHKNRQDMCSDFPNRMEKMDGSSSQAREGLSEH